MYNFLSLINILLGVYCGYKVSSSRVNTSRQYWLIMFWPILAFAITYGLRYGWLIDFNLYEMDYENLRLTDEIKKGWLWTLLSRVGRTMNWPFNAIVTISDTVIIVCFCAFIRPYKKYAYWILPIFYFVSFLCSNFIAFYPALSLFLLAIGVHLRMNDKFDFKHPIKSGLIYPLVLLLLAFGFHRAVLVCLLLYALVLVFNLKPKAAIVIYTVSFFFSQDWWMDILQRLSLYASFLDSSSFSEYYEHYVTDADTFFTTDGTEMKEAGGSLFYFIRTFFVNCFAILLYYKYRTTNGIDNARDKILEMSVIGLVWANIAAGVPVFSRIGYPFQLAVTVLYAVAIVYGLKSQDSKYKLMAIYIIIVQGYFYLITMYLRDTSHFYYIWDSARHNIYF